MLLAITGYVGFTCRRVAQALRPDAVARSQHAWLLTCRAEALFADLGHFNRQSIQIGMLFIVYPALLLTYLGQAAYLTAHPEDVRLLASMISDNVC